MTLITGKQKLNRTIRECFDCDLECPSNFPQSFTYCEGLGEQTFRITIEKLEDDFFIDSRGRKWARVKNDEVTA